MTITDSKEVGLAIGQILGSQLFGFEDLHYGYWTPDLAVTIGNFKVAQERYSRFLISQIPPSVKSILDVGAGSGTQAERLLNLGFQVDCVSPSRYLAQKIQERLKDRVALFTRPIEECSFERRYDLILFSESFQYVNMGRALAVATHALSPGGFVLISDFFKKCAAPEGPLGGGHIWPEFEQTIVRAGLTRISDLDITGETAPTMEMFGTVLTATARPVRDLVCGFIQHRHPGLYRFLAWKFKERFRKLENKYFAGALTASSFKQYKTYRTLLYQKTDC